jgi:1-acyl-sn-glycerol-3-phosphate acyltransferase
VSSTAAAPTRASAATARNVAALLVRGWRVRTTAAHLVPADGPVLLAAAHTAFLDQLLLMATAPRPVHVLSGPEAYVPPFGSALRASGQIRYDVEAPDRSALQAALGLLSDGGVVGLFPEGPVGSGDVRHVHHEVAYLAARSGATVVPVAILGARPEGGGPDALPRLRARIDVVYGEPVDIRVDGDPSRRAVLARSGERLRQALADHVRTACARTGTSLPGPVPSSSSSRSTA